MNTSIFANTVVTLHYACASSTSGIYIFTVWFVLHLLLLPLFLLVLYIGSTKWWKGRSSAAVSHMTALTFHMTVYDMIVTVAAAMLTIGIYRGKVWGTFTGILLFCFTTVGQTCLHSLTCMERYLAVVHPITYLRLKTRGGVYIRNVSIAMSWLISVGYMLAIVFALSLSIAIAVHYLLMAIVSVTVTFCCISVLCALIQPGPGDRRKKMGIAQSKHWAFATVMTILGVLMVRQVQLVVMGLWPVLPALDPCVMVMCVFLFSLPSSVVLPLLFLHRTRRLSHCF